MKAPDLNDYIPQTDLVQISKEYLQDLQTFALKAESKIEFLSESDQHRIDCRDYLMQVESDEITVEDCLESLGYGRNGLGS